MIRTGFQAPAHGFNFSNNDITWLEGKFKHLCGGMVYDALDYYHAGLDVPDDVRPPAEGTALHRDILGRQMDAHVNTVLKFGADWVAANSGAVYQASTGPRFAELKAILASRPVPICLVGHVGKGHHCVALGSRSTGSPAIYMYDPNYPRREVLLLTGPGSDGFVIRGTTSKWHGFFVDVGYQPRRPTHLDGQPNWRWCAKCQGLFYLGGSASDSATWRFGRCPGGGVHSVQGSGNYVLPTWSGAGQSGWRWCCKCEGLFFGRTPAAAGTCPKRGPHDGSRSADYVIPHGSGGGQSGWRWCRLCEGLFFGGPGGQGRCPTGVPADGSPSTIPHDGSQSGSYSLPMM